MNTDSPRDFVVYLVPFVDEVRGLFRTTLRNLSDDDEPIDVDEPALFLECLYLALHLVDRLTFARDGADGRDQFMDGLLDGLSEAIPSDELERGYRDVQSRYGHCRIEPDTPGGPLAGTLDWEIGTHMARQFHVTNPVSITVLAACASAARSVATTVYDTARPPRRG